MIIRVVLDCDGEPSETWNYGDGWGNAKGDGWGDSRSADGGDCTHPHDERDMRAVAADYKESEYA